MTEVCLRVDKINAKGEKSWYFICNVCGRPLKGNWCTSNVCQVCCLAGKCPSVRNCKAYPGMVKRINERQNERKKNLVIINPSKRIKLSEDK